MQTHQPSDLDYEQQTATAVTGDTATSIDEHAQSEAAAGVSASFAEPGIDTGSYDTVEPEAIPAEPVFEQSADTAPSETAAAGLLDESIAEATLESSIEQMADVDAASAISEPAQATDIETAAEVDSAPIDAPAAAAVDVVPEAETAASPGEEPPTGSAEAAPSEASVEPQEVDASPGTPPSGGSVDRLVAEVEAAPHKVYLLGRVRKAIAAAGDGEPAERLRGLESQIREQVAARTAAKEALCERAEALQDSTSWKATGDAFKALFDEWKQVGAAGRELDDQLWARFNLARGAFNERRAKHFEEREKIWSANREQKEALCVEAEALVESTDWKKTAEAIRDLQARWKAAGSAGREKDEALWAHFNTAKQQFFDRRTAAWAENRKRKEALVADAEVLKDSTDWRTAGDALKAMQAEWKNVGAAGREYEDDLWNRFRAATQSFFDRRSSTFAERDKSERENLAAKQELCQRAEALAYTGDALSAAREAKDLQAQWKEIGPVPREQSETIWARFRGACDKIFEHASGERDRQQNEWHNRMREAMTRKREQLTSLRESIAHDEANIERWRESLSSLKPGGKSEEIGKGLEDKIIDVMNRIREKQGRVEDLRSSINDIEAKLKE
jgi:hypothetical protein